MERFKNIQHLDQQCNKISKIEGIDHMNQLTTLNLDYNKIKKLEGLEGCYKLKRIFLNKNMIQVVEGQHYCQDLTELYIESQNFQRKDEVGMYFDKDSMIGMSASLRILQAKGNKIRITDNLEYLCNYFLVDKKVLWIKLISLIIVLKK